MTTANTPRPKALLFDLGGVVVQWRGIDALCDLTGWSSDDVLNTFKGSALCEAHELGQCDDDAFIDEIRKIFDLSLSHSAMKTAWMDWLGAPYPGIADVLKSLKSQYVTACLSNTNALHWRVLAVDIATDRHFHFTFASHLMHLAKPDTEIYLSVIEKMHVSPCEIWFFDDSLSNVEAAQEVGMSAFHVDKSVGVIPTLEALQLT